ncbi:MAG: hypothetical protein HKP61_05310 [Dactylosporangium sp.]|nr:hypothetical protein [Dactylosporangium sp.]NNJ60365.1 hypothetical protein [Dactylosporangium sp.]
MTEPEPIRVPAPDAIGDIVPGDPPVPITVWYVSAARTGETMSMALAERLIINFTHGRRLVIDLSVGDQIARAASTTRRRYTRHTAQDLDAGTRRGELIVAGWPQPHTQPEAFLADCATRVMAGGCVAIVLRAGALTVNQLLIGAARAAGLTYLQHIVAAHELSDRRGQLRTDGTHLPVHSDVLIFSSSLGARSGAADG